MSNPLVREVGRVADVHGAHLAVGVDHGSVTVGGHALDREHAEMFAVLFVAASWQAGKDAEAMARDA